ncbi:MAG: hypothetical protein C0505_05680 [Leptothrix sp. (in: Bacteria)]|nr:hypothetical protein [Leptothrix sp. (in: b-proteobacteria)]
MNARKLSFLALAAASLAVAGSASAQTRTYSFTDRNVAGSPTGGCNTSLTATTGFGTGSFGNSILCQQAGNASTTTGSQTLSVSAWSSDGSGSTYRTAAVNDQGASGFGIANQTEGLAVIPPGHSADNATPGVDLWQLNFSSAQALKSITLGWAGADGDFQVLRWGGTGAATSVNTRTAAQLLTDGWVLMNTGVGANTVFDGTIAEPQTFNFNGGNLTSTSWLVSAYNSSWAGTGATVGVDEIKIQGITTSGPTAVSAPGTLTLAGLGLLCAGFLRRRNAT